MLLFACRQRSLRIGFEPAPVWESRKFAWQPRTSNQQIKTRRMAGFKKRSTMSSGMILIMPEFSIWFRRVFTRCRALPSRPTFVSRQWSSPPPNASMLAFGNLAVASDKVTVQGWLYDVKNTASPQVLGKQYNDVATTEAVRVIAHKFANEIIFRLGGGIPGIAESKIYFVSDRTGKKEIWAMDYDGANQHVLQSSEPSRSRLGFLPMARASHSADSRECMGDSDVFARTNRMVSFPRLGGTNLSPAWAPDGIKFALSSSRGGYPNIYVMDASGGGAKRLTSGKGPDVGPSWNRKTGSQIAFVSGRSGLPQIYTWNPMERTFSE